MKLYQCTFLLHDYLFFATTERGKVAETGPFIHNYALTYAFGWAISPWYHEEQKPHYREELARVGKRYLTPARLIRGSYVVSQYNTLSEHYSMSKGRSIGYPDWGFVKCFRPGTLFRGYVLSQEETVFPRFLRLGKFMAKTEIHVIPAENIQQTSEPLPIERTTRADEPDQPLLNWNDLTPPARPAAFDIIANALPSHLIANAVFQQNSAYLLADFPAVGGQAGRHVQLPLHMGYYGENICVSW
jgi:CRISPR-associated protein Csc1